MSNGSRGAVLIVDDDREFALVAKTVVEVGGFSALLAGTEKEALDRCGDHHVDVVLLDWMLGKTPGLGVLRALVRDHPRIPVIVVTGHGSMESAAEALREAAFDYIGKPFSSAELVGALQRAMEWRAQFTQDPGDTRPLLPVPTSIVGKSTAMVAVYRTIARVAPADSTVLIVGESGTGKELVARALHDNSPRRSRPFVAVNCGAFTEALLESELFGHVRGAFTGALNPHRGVFDTAGGGTVFLDEISETSAAFQVKLLRVLQEHEIRPVGAPEARRIDVRVVAATNRRIPDLVASGAFRQDLLYRLSVITIELPALRERREDIPSLVAHFLQKANTKLGRSIVAAPEAVEWLTSLDWPGNVRELENAVERAVTLSVGGLLRPEDFAQVAGGTMTRAVATTGTTAGDRTALSAFSWECRLPATLDEVEREHIVATLRYTEGNKLRAADLLGIGRYSLYRKAKRLGIDLDNLESREEQVPQAPAPGSGPETGEKTS